MAVHQGIVQLSHKVMSACELLVSDSLATLKWLASNSWESRKWLMSNTWVNHMLDMNVYASSLQVKGD